MTTTRRRTVLGATAVVALLLVAGCSDDDGGDVRDSGSASGSGSGSSSGSGSASGSGTEATGAPGAPDGVELSGQVNDEGTGAVEGGEVDVELDDFYFGPTYIEAEPGSTVTVHLTNEGDQPHTFTIDEADVDEELQPGDTMDVEVTVPDAPSTTIYCRFHQGTGMQGAFFSA